MKRFFNKNPFWSALTKASESCSGPEAETLVNLVYSLLLKRSADPQGLVDYSLRLQRGELTSLGLMQELMDSEEYQQAQGEYDYLADASMRIYFSDEVLTLSAQLEACQQVSREDYETAWNVVFNSDRVLIIGQKEYGRQHKQRFWELVNAMGLLLQGMPKPQVLEFGVSEFSGLYGKLFPHMQFHTSDRPTSDDYIGFTEAVCKQLVEGDHLPLDLTDTHALNVFVQQQEGRFDLILLTEVLEHLCIHPVDILRPLIQALSSQGMLYLTTPNFFALDKRQLMQCWQNPQEVYPAADGNWDAHHHHREYCLTEMLPFIEQAGGYLKGFYYSGCWDQQPCDNPAERANMVFLISASSR
jgi:hypothetical protein